MKMFAALIMSFLVTNLHAETSYRLSSLCVDQDEIYFSCRTKNLKTISLCGKKEGGLYYRFGKREKVELEYPGNNVTNEDSLSLFFYNHYTRWMVDYFTVTFHNQGYWYVIQDLRSNENEIEEKTQNITISTNLDQGNEKIISCVSDVISNLRPLMNIISCHKEMALGCQK